MLELGLERRRIRLLNSNHAGTCLKEVVDVLAFMLVMIQMVGASMVYIT
jgi:hypothetical protein